MQPVAGEPLAGPWEPTPLPELVLRLSRNTSSTPCVVAIDGRSGSGKTTLAGRLAAAVPASAVVAVDDVAWHAPMFGWADLLLDGVLRPLRRGEAVSFRPPAWEERGRAGAIVVPPDRSLVLVEGVGAGRRELAGALDALVWVQSDQAEAERRGIARDVASGVNGDRVAATEFWHEWMTSELPFLAADRPWERASLVVAGTRPEPEKDLAVRRPPVARQPVDPHRQPGGRPLPDDGMVWVSVGAVPGRR